MFNKAHALILVPVALFALLTTACDDGDPNPSSTANTTADAAVADASSPDSAEADALAPSCQAVDPPCQDQSIQTLDFFDTPSDGRTTEEGTKSGEFLTLVDATGGGFNPSESFVYMRFDESGLKKVALDDEAALLSSDWDIAARRFIVRLNSGVSGPSCVEGARTAAGTTFDRLTAVPGELTFRKEAYFTSTCDYVPDTSGIGAPSTVLGSYWTYPGCVKMSGNLYVVRLANGRHVKLQIVSFYSPENQQRCNAGQPVQMPSGSGQLRIRWAFLD